MIDRIVPTFAVLSMLVAFPAIAETFSVGSEFRLAFADRIGARGITLSNGVGDAEEDEEAQAHAADVTFHEPFVDIDAAINGRSISDLIAGSPLHAPIEGLPEAIWKEKDCASCHAWTQETLCDQGLFYGKQGLGAVERKEHPYGGPFKREIMRWADRGCE